MGSRGEQGPNASLYRGSCSPFAARDFDETAMCAKEQEVTGQFCDFGGRGERERIRTAGGARASGRLDGENCVSPLCRGVGGTAGGEQF